MPYAISFFDNNTGIINATELDWPKVQMQELVGINWIFGVGYRDGDIEEGVFFEIDGALIAWSSDLGENFVFLHTLDYQGSHSFLKAKDHRISVFRTWEQWVFSRFSNLQFRNINPW